MKLLSFFVIAFVLVLGPAAMAADDIVPATEQAVALGRNWYPLESSQNVNFRWVDNNAEIVVKGVRGSLAHLLVTLEAGPGLGTPEFPLIVLDSNGRQVDAVLIRGRTTADLLLPVKPNTENLFRLHVEGGGKHSEADPRSLNFRVFDVNDANSPRSAQARSGDIVDPRNGVRLGGNWYTLEVFRDQHFRWFDNNASVFITASKEMDANVRMLAQGGPGIGGPGFAVNVKDSSGKVVATVKGKTRQVVLFRVHLKPGENEFELGVDHGGKKIASDPRVLNVQVFSLAALR